MLHDSLPIIDLQPLWKNSSGVYEVAEQIKTSFKDIGFAYIKNHKIPGNLLGNMFEAAEDFYALPLKSKMKIVQNKAFRGFLPINES
ncbi:MAG: 2-oxoglutarate and iron-dependent oxygenase domain-containing protein [Pseudomonadota bacterium]